MPLQDFLAGAALFALMLALVGAATALVVRRRLRHLDRLELAMASVVVGTGILIGVHLLPLILGVLTRGTVMAAALLAAGLAALVNPAQAALEPDRAAGPGTDRSTPPSSQASGALAALAGIFAAVAALADLGRWAGDELVGVDPLTFHLPNVGRWIQNHTMWQIDQFAPLLAHGNYPNNGDVVLLSAVLPWHNDFLVRLPITFFLATTAVAVFAVARELRASHAAAMLAAAAVVSLPVVGLATIPRALPDSLMWTTFACGVLFGLRRARSGRRSDLVLAGIALGIAAGTKWYGVSSVAVVVVIWIVVRLVAARRHQATAALRDAALVAGLSVLGVLPWLVRNLLLSDNPVFPLKVSPLGLTIFDAPPDVIRDQAGFTIADYLGDADVLRQLAGEIVEGLGVAPILCAVALLLAIVLAQRRGRAPDVRVLLLSLSAIVLGLVYTVTPATALGLRGDPSLAHANTRYAVPALLIAIPIVAWVAGRLPRLAGLVLEATLAAAALAGAYRGYAVGGLRDVALAAAALAALTAAAGLLWRLRERRVVLAAAAVAAAILGLAAAHRIEGAINDGRYRGIDPAVDTLLRVAPGGKRIGLASDWSVGGLSPVWPAFGTRIANDVEYVGEFVDGFLTPYRTAPLFEEALRHGGFDVLVIGRGFYPPEATPEQRWAIDAGWRTIALSPRLRVLVPPAAPAQPQPQPQP